MMYEFNQKAGRAFNDHAVFGFACYEGTEVDSCFEGRHVGAAPDLETARAWLATGDRTGLMRIYNEGERPEDRSPA
jgi:hypothetical protein